MILLAINEKCLMDGGRDIACWRAKLSWKIRNMRCYVLLGLLYDFVIQLVHLLYHLFQIVNVKGKLNLQNLRSNRTNICAQIMPCARLELISLLFACKGIFCTDPTAFDSPDCAVSIPLSTRTLRILNATTSQRNYLIDRLFCTQRQKTVHVKREIY